MSTPIGFDSAQIASARAGSARQAFDALFRDKAPDKGEQGQVLPHHVDVVPESATPAIHPILRRNLAEIQAGISLRDSCLLITQELDVTKENIEAAFPKRAKILFKQGRSSGFFEVVVHDHPREDNQGRSFNDYLVLSSPTDHALQGTRIHYRSYSKPVFVQGFYLIEDIGNSKHHCVLVFKDGRALVNSSDNEVKVTSSKPSPVEREDLPLNSINFKAIFKKDDPVFLKRGAESASLERVDMIDHYMDPPSDVINRKHRVKLLKQGKPPGTTSEQINFSYGELSGTRRKFKSCAREFYCISELNKGKYAYVIKLESGELLVKYTTEKITLPI